MATGLAPRRLCILCPIYGSLCLSKFPPFVWRRLMAFWKEQFHILVLAACQRPKEIIKKVISCGFVVTVLLHAWQVSKKLAELTLLRCHPNFCHRYYSMCLMVWHSVISLVTGELMRKASL